MLCRGSPYLARSGCGPSQHKYQTLSVSQKQNICYNIVGVHRFCSVQVVPLCCVESRNGSGVRFSGQSARNQYLQIYYSFML